jgi:galactokinase
MSDNAVREFMDRFGTGPAPSLVSAPGRVNLIGEHIDYHDLPVLPMAIQRRIRIAFRSRPDSMVRAASSGPYGERAFDLSDLDPGPSGDWINYLKAAARAAFSRWPLKHGVDAGISSELPAAAGLASSSALLVGFTLALLAANRIEAAISELMDILPEGEQFVGTRGGGMDHAAVLASQPGCALLVRFAPVDLSPIPIPHGWRFLVAHSLTMAEKSGAVRAEYNARRTAGARALAALGLSSYRSAVASDAAPELASLAEDERRAFLHVNTEARRVESAVSALQGADAHAFGQLLLQSHASLRDNLRVSSPALDELVEIAMDAGAFGARLTGAGFGGCAVILCDDASAGHIRQQLIERFYSQRPALDPANHIIAAEPSAGALCNRSPSAQRAWEPDEER